MDIVLFIFNLGYLVQLIGSIILVRRIKTKSSIENLSLETQIMYFIGLIMRFIYVFDTRLLEFWFNWIEITLSFFISIYIIYLFYQYRHTKFADTTNILISWKIIMPACLILAFFFHPGDNKNWFHIQMLVSASIFIEACGLLPQIDMNRKNGSVDIKLGQYLVCMGLSRFLRLIFWFLMWISGDDFMYLIVADLIHSIILADFIYLFMKSKNEDCILLR